MCNRIVLIIFIWSLIVLPVAKEQSLYKYVCTLSAFFHNSQMINVEVLNSETVAPANYLCKFETLSIENCGKQKVEKKIQ